MLLISLYQTKCYFFDEPADLEIKRTFNDRFTRMLLNSSLKTSTICRLKDIKEYAYDKTKFNKKDVKRFMPRFAYNAVYSLYLGTHKRLNITWS